MGVSLWQSIALFVASIRLEPASALSVPRSSEQTAVKLAVPSSADGASIEHSNTYGSFSFEPAFWVEFFGNASNPNALTFELLSRIVKHGGRPIIR